MVIEPGVMTGVVAGVMTGVVAEMMTGVVAEMIHGEAWCIRTRSPMGPGFVPGSLF
jgi:hypothetical protein